MEFPRGYETRDMSPRAAVAFRIGRIAVGLTEVAYGLTVGIAGTAVTGGLSWLCAAPIIAKGLLRTAHGIWENNDEAPAPIRVAEHIASLRPVKVLLGLAESFGAALGVGAIPHAAETAVQLALATGSITAMLAGTADWFTALVDGGQKTASDQEQPLGS